MTIARRPSLHWFVHQTKLKHGTIHNVIIRDERPVKHFAVKFGRLYAFVFSFEAPGVLAVNAYELFSREYKLLLNENYPRTLADITSKAK